MPESVSDRLLNSLLPITNMEKPPMGSGEIRFGGSVHVNEN